MLHVTARIPLSGLMNGVALVAATLGAAGHLRSRPSSHSAYSCSVLAIDWGCTLRSGSGANVSAILMDRSGRGPDGSAELGARNAERRQCGGTRWHAVARGGTRWHAV